MISFTTDPIGGQVTDVLLLPAATDSHLTKNRSLVRILEKALGYPEFSGKKDEKITLYSPPNLKATRVIVIGIGEQDRIDAKSLRTFAAKGTGIAVLMGLSDITIVPPAPWSLKLDQGDMIEALIEGALLGNHRFSGYKEKQEKKPLDSISIFLTRSQASRFGHLFKSVPVICSGTALARDWVNMPSNLKTPEKLSELFIEAASKTDLAVSVLKKNHLEKMGFGALLSVAAGSRNAPRLVTFEHKKKNAKDSILLLGKGITFDSGGINIKPSSGLETMKSDMSGAAAVAATLIVASTLDLDVNLTGIMPLVENMPSGSATRPGDVVFSLSGKSIEIKNTDAEGRLILSDAMTYAIKHFYPDIIIDIATLTGACVVALGERIAGLFSNSPELLEVIRRCGEKTGERCWPLPLPEEYTKLLKSEIADIANVSDSRWGGAITAALFLKEFAEEKKWAHLDIAGPAFLKKGDELVPSGGTGFGVRVLISTIRELIKGL